jgi:predicted metal-dependent phosphotriesterase family hydrolase
MMFQTVIGAVPVEQVELADAHAHAWIAPPAGVPAENRYELDNYEAIRAELDDFRAAGGTTLIDCQPGGCGRDANRLRDLAQATGLHITATTGFHLRKYYPPDSWLWSAPVEKAAAYFVGELTTGMVETGGTLRATTIKIAYEGTISGQPRVLMEAAAEAARQTGALLLFHTERGANVEALPAFFAERGIPANRLYLCHVDKRPDIALHRELAQAGVLLGYDTFVRPQYDPEQGAWPLLKTLVADGLSGHIAISLDLAMASLWRHYGGQVGLVFLPQQIIARLQAEGFSTTIIHQLTAQNIASRLVPHA